MNDEITIIVSRKQLQESCDLFCKNIRKDTYKTCKRTAQNMVKCWAFYRLDFQIIKTEDK